MKTIPSRIRSLVLTSLVVIAGFVSQSALATPLTLQYSVSSAGAGLYNYNFTLINDNHDGSWQAGQGWGWVIFGDVANNGSTPLTNFIGSVGSLDGNPWSGFTTSFGGHNGPTLSSVLSYWVPANVGASETWSGTSTADLLQGQLLWSTIQLRGNAVGANFEVANRVSGDVPEPATFALFGLGLAGLGVLGRRKRRL